MAYEQWTLYSIPNQYMSFEFDRCRDSSNYASVEI